MLPPWVAAALGPVIAGAVWRARLLTTSGAIAAAALGSAAALAGLDWMALLLAFFVSSVALGKVGRAEKAKRSQSVIAKAGPRDATQVLANGGVFGLGAFFAAQGTISAPLASIALGALAAAAADTWGTEIGMLARSKPRSILTWMPLDHGMSGGVSARGLVATVGGALTIALIAAIFRWPAQIVVAGAIGGVVGAMADSVLGATLQQRRRSQITGRLTERLTDSDGRPTVAAGGLDWVNNDVVNLAASLIGAGTAFKLHFLLSVLRAS